MHVLTSKFSNNFTLNLLKQPKFLKAAGTNYCEHSEEKERKREVQSRKISRCYRDSTSPRLRVQTAARAN